MTAVDVSSCRIMSDSLIAFQPAIDEPSNIKPSSKTSSLMVSICCVTCCNLPRGSVKRRSTYFASNFLIRSFTGLDLAIGGILDGLEDQGVIAKSLKKKRGYLRFRAFMLSQTPVKVNALAGTI